MVTKHRQAFLLCLALAVLLAGLSGCGGPPASSQAGTRNVPDQVQIAIHVFDLQVGKTVVILTDVSLP